jgi:hypothetical protein
MRVTCQLFAVWREFGVSLADTLAAMEVTAPQAITLPADKGMEITPLRTD